MNPEQRIAFRIVATTSMLFSSGCDAIATSRLIKHVEESTPAVSSPLPDSTPSAIDIFVSPTRTPSQPPEWTPTIEWTATATEIPEPYILSSDSPIRLDNKISTTMTFQLGSKQEIVTFIPNKFDSTAKTMKESCPVGTAYGCTFSEDNRTFVFLDSGWFGKIKLAMEWFRAYVEGTSIVRTKEDRNERLKAMEQTPVTIEQDGSTWNGEITAALYIPHEYVEAFTKDVSTGPDIASQLYPEYKDAIQNGIVFLEFCGWDKTLPKDKYTASRYLIIIGASSAISDPSTNQ